MGRRALRKLAADDLLPRWLKMFEELPDPWSPEALFGRSAPLEIELGSGKGLFLTSAATANPGTDFLGLEVARKYAEFSAARLAKRDLGNARVVHGDGLRVFRERLPAGSVAAIHVYFPDPWWKARHRKRRVMNSAFLTDVERTLMPGGRLHFWTDVGEYFDTTLELIAAFPRLTGPLQVPETPAAHDLDYRTHFERRMRQHGLSVFRSEFVRRADC
ncbi:MAG TPA: tRNA (guanosine(46)-N7)-methyltransferase TrmB [Pirellulales bacterium]|jgi:tRNA (guanine-N7-)-methyltransferase|nr:tRNA (guanosine(46)-N7)-methyltransferase TrmB [Pirellulales bacterium]